MAWTWGDSIDATTDLQDVSLWNSLLRAVHKRYVASNTPQLGTGVIVSFDPPTIGGNALKGHPYNFTEPIPWTHVSLAEMQKALTDSIFGGRWVNLELYPDAMQGLTWYQPHPFATPHTLSDDFFHNIHSIAELLGFPPVPNPLWRTLWRRRCPRRIYTLTETHNPSPFGGGDALEAGDLAQYYSDWDSTPETGDPWKYLTGTYRGVYVYLGGGEWEPAPTGSKADVLDSNNEWESKGWTYPGPFEIGDYFGWHLLRDICEACKLLKATYRPNYTYDVDASDPGHRRKVADLNYAGGAGIVGLAAAQADAESRMHAATPDDVTFSQVQVYTYWSGPWGSNTPPDQYVASARTARFKAGNESYNNALSYLGIAREVDTFAFAGNAGSTFQAFDNFGMLPLLEDQWAKIATTTHTAGAHEYGTDLTPTLIDYPTPGWGANAHYNCGWYIGANHHAYGDYLASVTHWAFNDT